MSVQLLAPKNVVFKADTSEPKIINNTLKIFKKGKTRAFTLIYDNEGNINMPSFEHIDVSTMTIIAYTNLVINIKKFQKYIPCTPWTIIKKKRGRKKREQFDDPNKDIPVGSIVSNGQGINKRGVNIKTSKRNENGSAFKHSIPVVMVLENKKLINTKISRSGNLQMTGCKSVQHAVENIKHLYQLMIETEEWTGETLFTFRTYKDDQYEQGKDITEEDIQKAADKGLEVVFRPVMINKDFGLGYRVRRDLLDKYINQHTEFRSIFDSSVGTSVNIKIRANTRYDNHLVRLSINGEGKCKEDTISHKDFIQTLPLKDQQNETKHEKYHTFLVFASGNVIMSSSGLEMSNMFYKLLNILIKSRNTIEEKEMKDASIEVDDI